MKKTDYTIRYEGYEKTITIEGVVVVGLTAKYETNNYLFVAAELADGKKVSVSDRYYSVSEPVVNEGEQTVTVSFAGLTTTATKPANNGSSSKASTATAAPAPTASQSNALRMAKQYLDYTAFSHSGLIEQLEYEGFSNTDATYGADNCGADWNAQAAKKAQEYLDYTAFSRQGLIEQLEYEGFTADQAAYGASAVGL